MVEATTLADVIRRNTTTTNLQDNVFFFHNTIEGQVFIDADRDGRQDRGEPGLAGITVELLDLDGNLVASAITARNGSYTFEEVDLGMYRVRVSLPTGLKPTSCMTVAADLTRAEAIAGIDFGVALAPRPGRPPRGQAGAQSLAMEAVSAELDAAPTLGSLV